MLREPPAPPTSRCLRCRGLGSARLPNPLAGPTSAAPRGTPAAVSEGQRHSPSGRAAVQEISVDQHHFPPARERPAPCGRPHGAEAATGRCGEGSRQKWMPHKAPSLSPRPPGLQAPPLGAGDSRAGLALAALGEDRQKGEPLSPGALHTEHTKPAAWHGRQYALAPRGTDVGRSPG